MGWGAVLGKSGVRVGICVGNSRMGTWEGTSHLSRHPHDGCSFCAYLMLHLTVKSFLIWRCDCWSPPLASSYYSDLPLFIRLPS